MTSNRLALSALFIIIASSIALAQSPADLEGTWARDDGPRYLFARVGDELLGRRIDDEKDELGCRVHLGRGAGGLRGEATFSRKDDETGTLVLAWEVKGGAGGLSGRIEGVDLDDEGHELGRTWEPHTWKRVGPLADAGNARKIAEVDRMIDVAIAAGTDDAIMAMLGSPQVADLEHVPGAYDAIAPRLQALAKRFMGAPSTVTASAPREAASGEGLPQPLSPHLPLVVDLPVACQVVGSDGAASLVADGFSLNFVHDEDLKATSGKALIPSMFEGDVKGIVEETPDVVIYQFDVSGETSVTFELKVVLGGKTYHAFPDRFTAFTRDQCDSMLAAARTLRLDGDAPAAAEAPVKKKAAPGGKPDMDGFLAKIDGTSDGVTRALKAYEREGLEHSQMDWYDLREPTVVKTEDAAGKVKVTIDFKAGMTIRTYTLVWEGAEIVEVIEVGMR